MKIKNIVTVLLVGIILASCVPAAKVVPTEAVAPTSIFTPIPLTPTITPTPTPENIVDAKDLSIWVEEFVHAYGDKVTVNDVEMDASQLTDEIRKNADSYTLVKEINGNEVSFLLVNDIPLAIRKSKENWSGATLGILGNIRGFPILTSVDLGDSNHNDLGYLMTARKFSGIVVASGFSEAWTHLYPPTIYIDELVKNTNLKTEIGGLYWHQDIPKDLTSDKASEFVIHRIDDIMPTLLKLRGRGTDVMLANEPTWCYKKSCGMSDSILLKGLGQDWIGKAFVEFYKSAKNNGLDYGKDYRIVLINNYGVEIPIGYSAQKANYDIALAERTKEYIQAQLGFVPDVLYGLQFHIGKGIDGEVIDGYIKVSPDYLADDSNIPSLIEHFQNLSQIGKIKITEVDFDQSVDATTRILIMRNLIQASLQSGVVEGLTFWSPLRVNNSFGEQGLYDLKNYTPQAEVYEIMKMLISY